MSQIFTVRLYVFREIYDVAEAYPSLCHSLQAPVELGFPFLSSIFFPFHHTKLVSRELGVKIRQLPSVATCYIGNPSVDTVSYVINF
jgi:hypothetical protein